jgi:hypothetical protein
MKQIDKDAIIESRLIETLDKTKKNKLEIARDLEKAEERIKSMDVSELANVGFAALIDEAVKGKRGT